MRRMDSSPSRPFTARDFVAGLLMLMLASVACADPKQAKDPVWGKEPCAHCKMIVGEPRHAAQLTTHDGERLFFDDVGCMALEASKRGAKVDQLWVRSDANAWVPARATKYRKGAKTPMNFGYLSDPAGPLSYDAVSTAVHGGGR